MNKKFIESFDVTDYEVLTDTGWSDIKASHKTIPYLIYEITTNEGYSIKCADRHIFFDLNMEEVYAKDLSPIDLVMTDNGLQRIETILQTTANDNMYDLELDDENHRYFTNGFLSHNTSAARAICNHHGQDYLYINASMEGRIDVIRNQIESFAHNFSLLSNSSSGGEKKLKVVILDEVDGASAQFFDAFKGFVEKTAKTTRFILTSNHINKIPDAVVSRFGGGIPFDFEKDEENELIKKYLGRLKNILLNEGVKIKGAKYDGVTATEGWDGKALVELIRRKYPDFRSILSIINGLLIEGRETITIEDIKKGYSVHKDVFELIIGNKGPRESYQYIVSNYSRDVDAVFSSLQNEFIEFVVAHNLQHEQYIPQLIITIAKYMHESQFVIDPVVSLLACVFEFQNIIRGGKS